MKRILFASAALVCFAAPSAFAGYTGAYYWETNGRMCQIIKVFKKDDENLWPWGDGGDTSVAINTDEIPDLERAIHNLKICDKFWKCVAQRDGVTPTPKGQRRPKHCYDSMWNGWKEKGGIP